MKDLYTKNYKTLLKEIEDGTKKKYFVQTVKLSILPTKIYIFKEIPIKIPMICLKKILKFIWKHQIRSDQISRSVMSNSLQPHESQHARPPCPSPTPGVH